MSISLADALRQVELQPGRVYRCQVRDLQVEVRVEKQVPDLLPLPLCESDVMLDPWTDLPVPEAVAVLQAAPGRPLYPDTPNIPVDESHDDLPTSHG